MGITTGHVVFATVIRSGYGLSRAQLMIDSLRTFGGEMGSSQVWIFKADPHMTLADSQGEGSTQIIPLDVPDTISGYPFAEKVCASARAEEMAAPHFRSLVWIDPGCLIINPPPLFDLGETVDAAVRPVHLQIVGLEAAQPLDAFWKRIYQTFGLQDIHTTVESFVDQKRIRAYFNSHAFSVNPSLGLMHRWSEYFHGLVSNREFQELACQDELHQIFLFQAILSTLLVTRLDRQRIRILPPVYNYPYNLQKDVPEYRRAESLNDLVCIAYEDRPLDPELMDDISVNKPLRSWLAARAGGTKDI